MKTTVIMMPPRPAALDRPDTSAEQLRRLWSSRGDPAVEQEPWPPLDDRAAGRIAPSRRVRRVEHSYD
jgi:hypothetical protein